MCVTSVLSVSGPLRQLTVAVYFSFCMAVPIPGVGVYVYPCLTSSRTVRRSESLHGPCVYICVGVICECVFLWKYVCTPLVLCKSSQAKTQNLDYALVFPSMRESRARVARPKILVYIYIYIYICINRSRCSRHSADPLMWVSFDIWCTV